MSLLDTPQKRLNPFIFDENERARPEFRDYILSSIAKFMPPETVKHVLLLGSMAGRQYSDTSDIDINVVLAEGYDREDYKEIGKLYSEVFYLHSTHPVNYHIGNYADPANFADAEYAVYDIINNM
jgi:predicted nucleotidyltransferase